MRLLIGNRFTYFAHRTFPLQELLKNYGMDKYPIIFSRRIFMKPLKLKVSITLDNDIVLKIKGLSEQDDRSFSQYINMVLKQHIAKKEKSK